MLAYARDVHEWRIKVMFFKSTPGNEQLKLFAIDETDLSYVHMDQTIQILRDPVIKQWEIDIFTNLQKMLTFLKNINSFKEFLN